MRTLIIGLDAFDPVFFEQLHAEGKTPNLGRYAQAGNYSRFRVTDPPQSEVSWTSIATGQNPGQHGLFDFVHRNPATYGLQVSLLPTQRNLLGSRFVPPHSAHTIFDETVNDGYPAASLWWPATFPSRYASPVRTIPGLGTPDIFGRLGVGAFYSEGFQGGVPDLKTTIRPLKKISGSRYEGKLEGPARKKGAASVDFQVEMINDRSAILKIEKQALPLERGKWSRIIEITFRMGLGIRVKSVTRVILTSDNPPGLYFLPLQLHPPSAPWPCGAPRDFVNGLWKSAGPFLTLGWPQDTTALNEGFINEEQFLTLCEAIEEERERVLNHLLDDFEEGLLACVFDTLDRVQHMFWKSRRDIIEKWYIKLDQLIGRIQKKALERGDAHIIVVSDHGFGNFDYKVHLNRWLINRKYLSIGAQADRNHFKNAHWQETDAYAVGLNSVYLNLAGRERDGRVSEGDAFALLNKLREDLLAWRGPDGGRVMQKVELRSEAFQGPLAEFGPDLFIGYRPPYRGSAETGLGGWKENEIEINQEHWGADHCFNADAVPGVLFSNRSLANWKHPSYQDFPAIALGKDLNKKTASTSPRPFNEDEDEEQIEKRLKDLGYL